MTWENAKSKKAIFDMSKYAKNALIQKRTVVSKRRETEPVVPSKTGKRFQKVAKTTNFTKKQAKSGNIKGKEDKQQEEGGKTRKKPAGYFGGKRQKIPKY